LDSLLKLAVEAHGGLNAWNKLHSLRANASIGGALWDQKQLPGLFTNTRVELKLRYQEVITHLVDLGQRIIFTPKQVSLETESERRSTLASTHDRPSWDKLPIPDGTNCMAGISAVMRSGVT